MQKILRNNTITEFISSDNTTPEKIVSIRISEELNEVDNGSVSIVVGIK